MAHEPFSGAVGTGSLGTAFEPGTYTNVNSGRTETAPLPGYNCTSRVWPLPTPSTPIMKSALRLSRIAF